MKQNKIKVAVSTDIKHRSGIIRKLLIEHGFAHTQSDAAKIILPSLDSVTIPNRYFIAVENFKWHQSPLKVQLLYEMAAKGQLVIVGCRSIPKQYEFICEQYY